MSATLQPVPGDGLLSRRGALVVLCAAPAADVGAVDAVLAAHEQVAATGGDAAQLADRLTAVLADRGGLDLVMFGPAGGSLMVAVSGHAWANVTTEHGEQNLALRHADELVRSVLPGQVTAVRAGLGDLDLTGSTERWVSLGDGVVRAGGLLYARPDADLSPARTEADAAVATAQLPPVAAEPAAGFDRSEKFSSVVLVQGGGLAPALDEPLREPLAVITSPPAPVAPDVAPAAHPVDESRVHVLGVYCKNGHFDDPSARYCAICGISMAQLTLVPRPGPRPPLGVLVLDDGSIFSLDTDYVIGRDPSQDPDVAAGTARPMRFEDSEGRLSRRHMRVVLDGWQVAVVDLGSANGTGVKSPGDSQWHTIPPRMTVPIRPGTEVGLGRRNFRYESHRNT